MTDTIYEECTSYLFLILEDFSQRIRKRNDEVEKETGYKLFEHLIVRVKTSEGMARRCQRKNLPVTTESVLKEVHDSISLRIVYGFVNDICTLMDFTRPFDDCTIAAERDYIKNARPNDYRFYHLVVEVVTPYPDCSGNRQDSYFIKIQLRTIAMDSWVSLEHQVKHKHDTKDSRRVIHEPKRCADELVSCDLTIQTIRDPI